MGSPSALDIDLLRSFVLIAEGGSFTRAAERVGRTQSAVSQQMQRLESLVGHRLFVRSKGAGAQLTQQGLYLLSRAYELVSLNDEIVDSLLALPSDAAEAPNHAGPQSETRAHRPKPSVAVLPFRNLTGDPDEKFFVEGVASAIVNALSRVGSIVVIARHSTPDDRRRPPDILGAGRALGARYLLEGGVFRGPRRIRITTRLTEAETEKLLWVERYDSALEDIFDLQDQIAESVVGIVEPSVQKSEIERIKWKRVENLDAYELYLRALPHVAAHMPSDAKTALGLLEKALNLDQDNLSVHALAAWCHELCFTREGFDKARRDAALSHARTTIAGDPQDATSLAVAGFVTRFFDGEHERGLATIDRALSLNPACATALYLGAQAHGLAGDVLGAAALASRALKLSPFDPLSFEAHMALGEAALAEERFDDAAVCFSRVVHRSPNFSTGYLFQGLSLAAGGRATEAGPVIRRGLELEPGFSARIVRETWFAPVVGEKFLAAARTLGLTE
ncbi:MAG TPA: LysR family transcriptional regulator [Roseiarcus sp.]